MKELNTSSTDAMQWAECLAERIDSGITPDADFLVGWFANYWAAVYDPLKAALEAAEAREAELRAEVLELIRTAVQRDSPVHKEQEQVIKYLRARVAELEGMVPKWVPVSERLPECEVDVLTFSVDYPEDGIVLESRISDCDWTTTLGEPTHWMPLPAVPKEEV